MQALKDDFLTWFRTGDTPSVHNGPSVFSSAVAVGMLVFETLDGNIRALPYGTLCYLHINPSTGITLVFPDLVIVLQGQNLNALFEGLCARTIAKVKVVDSFAPTSPGTVIVQEFNARIEKAKDAMSRAL